MSLLTILLGVTTFTVIENMAKSQTDIGVLQEFKLRIDSLATATTAQSNAFTISATAYQDFLANLDRSKELARQILQSDYCSPPREISSSDAPNSCQTTMLEAIDSYPPAVIDHYEKTLFTLRLINKNQYIYQKMAPVQTLTTPNNDSRPLTTIIHNLESLKHKFEETNNFDTILAMKMEFERLERLNPGAELTTLAKTFIVNSEQIYHNRRKTAASLTLLTKSTTSFSEKAANLHRAITTKSASSQRKIRSLITFLSLASVALTLLFWLLTSRRLTRFLNNQKMAINSIKSGNYDYPIAKDSDDELTALCAFTKTLAMNIKEEIGERQSSQKEKKTLQSQLVQSQRLESIGMLAGGIAHDFNNILTGITGYTDLALARLEDDHPAKRYLETIAQAGQKAREMTRQLQAFSKKQELHKQVINLNTLTTNLSKMLTRMIGENIVLELDTAPDLPNVMADPAQIEQVLLNMAVNAKDAMPEGGRLTIRTSTVTLDESMVDHLEDVDPGDFVQISITDSGAGIPEELQEKIFDPFFTTKDTHRGSGLGLATAFGIIKQHNGHVTLDSAPGQGSTFNFLLPAIDARSSDGQKPGYDLNNLAKGNETILLVDDNNTARAFVCDTLEYCGYKLLTASNGSQATRIMQQTDYAIDLLLTDVVMPGLNGPELAEVAKKIHPEIKVVFMSGYNDLSAFQGKDTLANAGDFLKKPLQIDTLSLKVREVLDR